MRIEYRANGMQRTVPDAIGQSLIDRNLARSVEGEVPADPVSGRYRTRELRPESEVDLLRAECDRRGIKYHHRAGVQKLRELLKADTE